jgi:hypothetical protein
MSMDRSYTEVPLNGYIEDVEIATVEPSTTDSNPELNMDLLLDRVVQCDDSAWSFTSYEEYDMVVKKPNTNYIGMKADLEFTYKNHDVYIQFK